MGIAKKEENKSFLWTRKSTKNVKKANSNGSNTGNGDSTKSYDDILKISLSHF